MGIAPTPLYRFVACSTAQYMTSKVYTVERKLTMRELEQLFEKHDFNAFPVVEDQRLLGIVTKFDFIRVFAFSTTRIIPNYEELMNLTVGEVLTDAVVHVAPETPLTRVLQEMVRLKSRSLPVLDKGRLVGMISREDIMRALHKATELPIASG